MERSENKQWKMSDNGYQDRMITLMLKQLKLSYRAITMNQNIIVKQSVKTDVL